MIYCVDLDGTLITYDMSVISFLRTVKPNLKLWPKCLFWYLTGGRAKVKTKVAKLYDFKPQNLPFNEELIAHLREIKAKDPSAEMFLVSGSDDGIVKRIANEFDFFTDGYGTSSKINLTGKRKLAFIKKQFPQAEICYVGNSRVDLEVWAGVEAAIVVSDNQTLIARAKNLTKVLKVFKAASGVEKFA